MTASTWTALPTWRGREGTYEEDGTCPRCGCDADYDGPYYRRGDNGSLFECSCPRCGLEWTLRNYPNPAYEGLSDEERDHRYDILLSEIIL